MTESLSLNYNLAPIKDLLEDANITEICICGEKNVFFEKGSEWGFREVESFNFDTLSSIANLIASMTNQSITKERPIMSAFLPSGERVQVVIPPASVDISITIRLPSELVFSLDDFEKMGTFKDAVISNDAGIAEVDKKLLALLEEKRYKEFFSLAVKTKKNILVSGATGSGKTTFMKGLILEVPLDERLITIEDVPELIIPHKNSARLLYSKDGQSNHDATVKRHIESCLRMRPDRILLAELRGEEAFYFVRNVNSGHPGTITSIHANSCEMAFDQLVLYIKESEAGQNLERVDILNLLHLLIDIVVQYTRDNHGNRVVSEVYFDPHKKLQKPIPATMT